MAGGGSNGEVVAGQGQGGTVVISCWNWAQKLLGNFVL